MTEFVVLAAGVYVALAALLVVAHLHRKKLFAWAATETASLKREADEIQVMRKYILQQVTWDATRGFYGNPLLVAALDSRIADYNRRRIQLIEVLNKAGKLLPW